MSRRQSYTATATAGPSSTSYYHDPAAAGQYHTAASYHHQPPVVPNLAPLPSSHSAPPNTNAQPNTDNDPPEQTSDFVKKLFKMLSTSTFTSIVHWNHAGDAFVVKDMNGFTTKVLPKLFKHNNFASFVRQLNKYDFHKVKSEDSPNSWTFKHPSFTSSDKSALENIKRKVPASSASVAVGSVSRKTSHGNVAETPGFQIAPAPSTSSADPQTGGPADSKILRGEVDRLKGELEDMKSRMKKLEALLVATQPQPASSGASPTAAANTTPAFAAPSPYTSQTYSPSQQEQTQAQGGQQLYLPPPDLSPSVDQPFFTSSSTTSSLQNAYPFPPQQIDRSSSLTTTEDGDGIDDENEVVMPTSNIRGTPPSSTITANAVPLAQQAMYSAPAPAPPEPEQIVLPSSSNGASTSTDVEMVLPTSGGAPESRIEEVVPPSSPNAGRVVPSQSRRPSPTGVMPGAGGNRRGSGNLQPGSGRGGAGGAAPPNTSWTTPPKVLLVDDDEVARRLSSKFLSIFGCTTDIAIDGITAVNKMRLLESGGADPDGHGSGEGVGKGYDLVLMDIVMPKLDGVSATSMIRKFDDRTPIISMTSNSRPDEIVTYYSSGMNDVLPKPFTKQSLFSILEKHLHHLHMNVRMAREVKRVSGMMPPRLPPVGVLGDENGGQPQGQGLIGSPPGGWGGEWQTNGNGPMSMFGGAPGGSQPQGGVYGPPVPPSYGGAGGAGPSQGAGYGAQMSYGQQPQQGFWNPSSNPTSPPLTSPTTTPYLTSPGSPFSFSPSTPQQQPFDLNTPTSSSMGYNDILAGMIRGGMEFFSSSSSPSGQSPSNNTNGMFSGYDVGAASGWKRPYEESSGSLDIGEGREGKRGRFEVVE